MDRLKCWLGLCYSIDTEAAFIPVATIGLSPNVTTVLTTIVEEVLLRNDGSVSMTRSYTVAIPSYVQTKLLIIYHCVIRLHLSFAFL